MTPEQNKTIVRRWYKDFFEKGNYALSRELFTSDSLSHDRTGPGPNGEWPRGPAGAEAVVKTYLTAFPDIRFTIEDQIAEGDLVSTRWTARGTNTGPIMGRPATGKTSIVSGIETDRLVNGKIAESWVNFDTLGMLVQLGLAPAPGQGKM